MQVKFDKIPTTPHYAVLEYATVSVDDGYDDRYPSYTQVEQLIYHAFTKRDEWESFISAERLRNQSARLVAFEAKPAQIKTTVTVLTDIQ